MDVPDIIGATSELAKDDPAREEVKMEVQADELEACQDEEPEVGTIVGGVRGGHIPPPQVSSVDSLLGDIYKLWYQVSQLNARIYHY